MKHMLFNKCDKQLHCDNINPLYKKINANLRLKSVASKLLNKQDDQIEDGGKNIFQSEAFGSKKIVKVEVVVCQSRLLVFLTKV